MANLQIRIDDELRQQAQQIANDMGMDLTTAVRVFLKQMVNDQGLPFKPELDPFYAPSNKAALKRSINQLNKGQVVTKSWEELEAMAQ